MDFHKFYIEDLQRVLKVWETSREDLYKFYIEDFRNVFAQDLQDVYIEDLQMDFHKVFYIEDLQRVLKVWETYRGSRYRE